MRRQSALVRPVALVATILTAAPGCDKANGDAPGAAAAQPAARPPGGQSAYAATPPSGDTTDLTARPHILYHVFGERNDPRIIPVAVLAKGRIDPIVLSPAGWQEFDRVYHAPGTRYTIYADGREAGWARVTRSMWDERGAPLYSLPRCRLLTPLAAADVKSPPVGYLVEHVATDAPLGGRARKVVRLAGDSYVSQARAVATRVAEAVGIEAATLEALDFRASAVHTGTNRAPTLVINFVDPTGGIESDGQATHIFVLAERGAGGYEPAYTRIVRPNSVRSEYRRYVDHLDLTGDGIDEVVLEGWSSGRESYMLILQFQHGRWMEVFQGRPSWCLDRK